MKIAVSFDNGTVFQHFGKTEYFKIYNVEEGKIDSSEVVSTGGTGHEALADFLRQKEVGLVICGGLGEGARAALAEAGILVCSGAEGAADEAVEAFLSGELTSRGANCSHHHDHEEEHHCGGGCGGCGGCGGGRPRILYEGLNAGKTVRVHYKGTYNDGSQFDSSYDRGEPLEFLCGAGMMIPGFDKAVLNMQPGETLRIHLMPEEAYGMPDPEAVFTVETAKMPGSEKLSVGQRVYLTNGSGQPFPVTVTAKDADTVTFDANHEMAGKELNFSIELIEVI